MVVNVLKALMIIALCLGGLTAQALSIDISIVGTESASTKIEKGKTFGILYKIKAQTSEELTIASDIQAPSKVEGCKVIDFIPYGSSTHSSYIMGEATHTYVVNYLLTVEAQKNGKHSFGPIMLGDTESNKLDFEIVSAKKKTYEPVKKSEDKSIDLGEGCRELFIKAELTSTQLYEKVPFEYVVKLYTLYDGISNFDFVKMPQFKNCDVVDEYRTPSRFRIEEVNGVQYAVSVVERLKVTPTKAGKLKMSKGKCKVTVDQSVYYDDPFWGRVSAIQQKEYALDIPEIATTIHSLGNDVPKDFSGIIGDFQLSSKLSNAFPRLNEPIVLSYIVAGEVESIESMISDKVHSCANDSLKIQVKQPSEQLPDGFKKYEYYITPLNEGVYAIPELELIVFNPMTKAFETIKTKGFKIVVGGLKN